jgi:hypothetical protein
LGTNKEEEKKKEEDEEEKKKKKTAHGFFLANVPKTFQAAIFAHCEPQPTFPHPTSSPEKAGR